MSNTKILVVEPFIYVRSEILPGLVAVSCSELGIHPDLGYKGPTTYFETGEDNASDAE